MTCVCVCGGFRSDQELWHNVWSLVPADSRNIWLQHPAPTSKQQQMAFFSGSDSITHFLCGTEKRARRELEVPLRSCCAAAALGRVPPVCCEPARPGCARSAAGPSPSSPGAASSAEPSAASDRSGAPPAAKDTQDKIHHTPLKSKDTSHLFFFSSFSVRLNSPAQRASWWWLPVSVLECWVCSDSASAAWPPSLNSHREPPEDSQVGFEQLTVRVYKKSVSPCESTEADNKQHEEILFYLLVCCGWMRLRA